MSLPFEWVLGWRYTHAGRKARRNGFISFISGVSMMGIALGVAALIVVLSVMNGFQKEVRDRMLSVIAHIEVNAADGAAWSDPTGLLRRVQAEPLVVGASFFVASQALLSSGETLKGAMIRGVDPATEGQVSTLWQGAEQHQLLQRLQPGAFGVLLGGELARALGVRSGDRITLVAAGGDVTPAGAVPRLKTLTVAGVFDTGHFEYDAALALMHLDDAARMFRTGGATGLRVQLQDVNRAPAVAARLSQSLGAGALVQDWSRQNRNWFTAVQIEKRMMGIILTLIVAVAAFNLVSTLVMTVTDKHADIAILRTLGASPGSIMAIFVIQGATVGVLGTGLGLLLGLGVAFNVDVIVPAIERALSMRFFAARHLPDQQHAQRPANGRHCAGGAGVPGAGVRGHALPQLACQPGQTGPSPAL